MTLTKTTVLYTLQYIPIYSLLCSVSGGEAHWQLGVGRLRFKHLSGQAHVLSAPPALVLPALPASSADPWCRHWGSPVCFHQ